MSEPVAVEFLAEIKQTKSMADGSFDVTLTLPETSDNQAAWLLRHRHALVKAVIVLEPEP